MSRRVSNPQISPNGARIVYARQQANKIEDRWDSSLWIMNSDGSQHRFLTKGSNPRWSSDGKRILYIADGEPRGPQIFVRWIDTDGPATQVTRFGNGYARLSEMVSPIPDGVRFATPTDPPNNEKIRYAKAGPTPKSPPGVIASPMEKTSKNSPSAELGMHLP